jgi:hypothetical protein
MNSGYVGTKHLNNGHKKWEYDIKGDKQVLLSFDIIGFPEGRSESDNAGQKCIYIANNVVDKEQRSSMVFVGFVYVKVVALPYA